MLKVTLELDLDTLLNLPDRTPEDAVINFIDLIQSTGRRDLLKSTTMRVDDDGTLYDVNFMEGTVTPVP